MVAYAEKKRKTTSVTLLTQSLKSGAEILQARSVWRVKSKTEADLVLMLSHIYF